MSHPANRCPGGCSTEDGHGLSQRIDDESYACVECGVEFCRDCTTFIDGRAYCRWCAGMRLVLSAAGALSYGTRR